MYGNFITEHSLNITFDQIKTENFILQVSSYKSKIPVAQNSIIMKNYKYQYNIYLMFIFMLISSINISSCMLILTLIKLIKLSKV